MRPRLALTLLLLSTPLAVDAAAPPMAVPSLDHVGIQASDLEKSVSFYTKVLGLREQPAPFPRTAARWIAFGNGTMLHIVAHGMSGAAHNKWDHFALSCADLPAMIAHLDAMHVPWADMSGGHAPQKRPDGVSQIFVHDPDGYTIELNDNRAR